MDKAIMVFWSGTGNTQAMAESIAKGVKEAGAELAVFEVSKTDEAQVSGYANILLGCPAMGAEVLEESEFEPFFTKLEPLLSGKRVGLFGSYGWGDGEWMRLWEDRVRGAGAHLTEDGLMINEAPDGQGIAACEAFGKRFAQN